MNLKQLLLETLEGGEYPGLYYDKLAALNKLLNEAYLSFPIGGDSRAHVRIFCVWSFTFDIRERSDRLVHDAANLDTKTPQEDLNNHCYEPLKAVYESLDADWEIFSERMSSVLHAFRAHIGTTR